MFLHEFTITLIFFFTHRMSLLIKSAEGGSDSFMRVKYLQETPPLIFLPWTCEHLLDHLGFFLGQSLA